jgi:outer membrane protein TolC
MNVPIWDSYSRHYIIQQSKLAIKKVRDNTELLKNSIDFEVERANVATLNAQARLNTQTRNLGLAKEVVRVTRIKYKQGVGTNLEVTNAETDLRVAQTNYYSAVYDALVAKVDADLATGRFTAN